MIFYVPNELVYDVLTLYVPGDKAGYGVGNLLISKLLVAELILM